MGKNGGIAFELNNDFELNNGSFYELELNNHRQLIHSIE